MDGRVQCLTGGRSFHPQKPGDMRMSAFHYEACNFNLPSAAADHLQGCKSLIWLLSAWIWRPMLFKLVNLEDRRVQKSQSLYFYCCLLPSNAALWTISVNSPCWVVSVPMTLTL